MPRVYHERLSRVASPLQSSFDRGREQLGAELVGRRRAHLQLQQAADLDLADALARQVHDLADLFERDAAALGDVERAGVLELPRLEVGEVDLDRPGLRVDVEIEVVLARDPRARPHLAAALLARRRARDIDRRIHQRALTRSSSRVSRFIAIVLLRGRVRRRRRRILRLTSGTLALGRRLVDRRRRAARRPRRPRRRLVESAPALRHRARRRAHRGSPRGRAVTEQVLGAPRGAGQTKACRCAARRRGA